MPQTGSDAHWGHHKSLVPVSAVHDGEKKFVNDRVVLQTAVRRCLILGHWELCQFFQMNYFNETESWFDFQISPLLMHLSLSNRVKFRGVGATVHRGVGFLTRKRNQSLIFSFSFCSFHIGRASPPHPLSLPVSSLQAPGVFLEHSLINVTQKKKELLWLETLSCPNEAIDSVRIWDGYVPFFPSEGSVFVLC